MKAATERKIIRWLHIILSIPILGYIYGPVAANPPAANAVRWMLLPVVVLSGLWMWKGHLLRKRLGRQRVLKLNGKQRKENPASAEG